MTLRLYNTLTRQKEDFKPLDPSNVRMYVCGPTVYDFAHIGNARPVIVFDVLFRLLRHLYGNERVTYVRNITDVDDKINARALERFPGVPLNEAIRKVTEETANQFFADAQALGCLEPDVQPRATEHIAGMIDMISVLIKKGNAYVAAGEVLFAVDSMPDYGRLSQRKLEDQQAGARVAVEAHKKNPADFVLWKLSSADEPGWDSPWGRGRPGWHIECSVMAKVNLGEVFDIHGGGLDLIFPHHENEIAQSRCAHGTKVMANYWMHNGFLQVEGQKMSKSLGNFVTINELLSGWRTFAWPGEVIRLAMLGTHYTQPLDFSEYALDQAASALSTFAHFADFEASTLPSEEFLNAMHDDLNTPRAIAELHRLAKVDLLNLMKATRPGEPTPLSKFADDSPHQQLAAGLAFLGIDIRKFNKNWMQEQLKATRHSSLKTNVEALISTRLAARVAKNWKESDRIRDELAAMGVTIKDNKDGTTSWEVKR